MKVFAGIVIVCATIGALLGGLMQTGNASEQITGASLISGGVLSLLLSCVVWLLVDIRTAVERKAQP
jgi:hypothetical protein